MITSPTPPPRIYSYVRFSSERQLKGDSLRRQNELIDRYTKEKGYQLDSEFRYVHVGPAFRGQNLKEGKFRLFIEAIREKKVPVNSILLIESLDRLTRLTPLEAISVFLEIINAGVTIVTLADGVEHSKNTPAQQQFANLLISITTLCRAHEESLTKSRRLKKAWEQKRRDIKTKYYTKKIPAWLQLSNNRLRANVIEEKAETVKRMFKLCIAGDNVEGIAKNFRNEKVPLVAGGKSWTHSYVSQTLRNPSVTGTFTPHRIENRKRVPVGEPICDYYPSIVSQKDFDRVQFIMDSRTKKKGGRVGGPTNLFRKMLFCGYCGAPVYRTQKGRYYKGDLKNVLLCRNAKDKTGCFYVAWNCSEFEAAFVDAATELKIHMKEKFTGASLRQEHQELSGRKSDLENKINNLMSMAESGVEQGSEIKAVGKRLRELEGEIDEVSTAKDIVEKKLSAGMDGPAPVIRLEKLLKTLESEDARKVVADLISQIIERIDLFPAGTKFDLARLKRMHSQQVKKHGKADGHVRAYIRDNFDRRKVRFFQSVLNLPGVSRRLTFNNTGKAVMEARLDLVEDLPEDAEMA